MFVCCNIINKGYDVFFDQINFRYRKEWIFENIRLQDAFPNIEIKEMPKGKFKWICIHETNKVSKGLRLIMINFHNLIGDEKYTTAQAANLVGTLPTLTAEKQEATGVYHITITLTWGSAFNNQNPLEYYNNQEYETELAKNAKTNLTALEALKDSKFTVTLTVTPNETN